MLVEPLDIFCLEVTYPIQVLYFPFHCICATGVLAEKNITEKNAAVPPFPPLFNSLSSHPACLLLYTIFLFKIKKKKEKQRKIMHN